MVKRNVLVRIDESLLDRLWQYIKKTYPQSTYGALSLEVQKAIEHWLSGKGEAPDTAQTPPDRAGTHTPPSQLSTKIMGEIPVLKAEVLKYAKKGSQIPKSHLGNIIRQAVGIVDHRAVNNRIEALVSIGFLRREWPKLSGPKPPGVKQDVIFTVRGDVEAGNP
jgi:hypothetical protein